MNDAAGEPGVVQIDGQQTAPPGGQTCLLPVFTNKVSLVPSHAHLFMYCLQLFSCSNRRVAVTGTIWPAKPKNRTFSENACQPLVWVMKDPECQARNPNSFRKAAGD